MSIINKSLVESDVPACLKKAHVRPLIKELNLDRGAGELPAHV